MLCISDTYNSYTFARVQMDSVHFGPYFHVARVLFFSDDCVKLTFVQLDKNECLGIKISHKKRLDS